jgi:hypothetical protein
VEREIHYLQIHCPRVRRKFDSTLACAGAHLYAARAFRAGRIDFACCTIRSVKCAVTSEEWGVHLLLLRSYRHRRRLTCNRHLPRRHLGSEVPLAGECFADRTDRTSIFCNERVPQRLERKTVARFDRSDIMRAP